MQFDNDGVDYNKKLQLLKSDVWKYYNSWRTTNSYSPAFGEVIYVTLLGWNHIIGNHKHKRRFGDVYRRLLLISYAREIIEASNTIQNITVRNGIKYYAFEAVVKIIEENVLKKVRVILREDKTYRKTFFSVMGKTIGKVPHA